MEALRGLRMQSSRMWLLLEVVACSAWHGAAFTQTLPQAPGAGTGMVLVGKGRFFSYCYPLLAEADSATGIVTLKGSRSVDYLLRQELLDVAPCPAVSNAEIFLRALRRCGQPTAPQPDEAAHQSGAERTDAPRPLHPAVLQPPACHPLDVPPTLMAVRASLGSQNEQPSVQRLSIAAASRTEAPSGGATSVSAQPAVTAGGTGERPPETPVSPAASPNKLEEPSRDPSWYVTGLVLFISNLAALTISLSLFSTVLFVFVRRFGVPLQVAPRPERPEANATIERVQPVRTFTLPGAVPCDELWSRLELGPTYADELRSKDAAAREQEEAMVRQLFEQNLALRDQIDNLCSAAE
jgi:hypothetical protein